jgi:head-tail adaptor
MGAPSNTYSDHSKQWAKRETVSINEEIAGRRVSILAKYKYTMYYDSDINESFRLVDGGVRYNILSVDPGKGRIQMTLMVEKIQT